MAALNFTVAFSTNLEQVLTMEPSTTIYAEDLGLCNECVVITNSCWPCLQTTQQVFNDSELTSPVANGYYMLKYTEDSSPAVWYIVNGYPQEGGFYN
jgi:hypothetical protein